MKITKQQLTAIQQIVMEELYLEAKNQLLMEVGEGPPHYYPDAQPGEIIDDPEAVKIDQQAQRRRDIDTQTKRTLQRPDRHDARRARGDHPGRGGRPKPSFWQRLVDRFKPVDPWVAAGTGGEKQQRELADIRAKEAFEGAETAEEVHDIATKGGMNPETGRPYVQGVDTHDVITGKRLKFPKGVKTGVLGLDTLLTAYGTTKGGGGEGFEVSPADVAPPGLRSTARKVDAWFRNKLKPIGVDPTVEVPMADVLPRAHRDPDAPIGSGNWGATDLKHGVEPGEGTIKYQGTEGGNVTGWAAGRQPGDENKKYNKEMEERQPGWNEERGRKADDSHMEPAPAIAESQEHNTLERWSLLAGVKK